MKYKVSLIRTSYDGADVFVEAENDVEAEAAALALVIERPVEWREVAVDGGVEVIEVTEQADGPTDTATARDTIMANPSKRNIRQDPVGD